MTRGNKKQVSRILEVKFEYGSYSSIIPSKMNKAGLKLKTIVTSNVPSDEESMNKLSDKLLGYSMLFV